MELGITGLSETIQTQKDKHHMISHECGSEKVELINGQRTVVTRGWGGTAGDKGRRHNNLLYIP